MTTPENLARLDAIEKALLDRWPETRIAPSLERIAALADMLLSHNSYCRNKWKDNNDAVD